MIVTMTTEIHDDRVTYTVSILPPYGAEQEVWHKDVPFGRYERYLAGGMAFVEVAREQAAVAEQYAQNSQSTE